ncbi:MAG: hypothetical protein RQM90_03255 [Methanoculleus sp.]
MGIGNTALAAIALDVDYIGFEIDPAYQEIAEARIVEARSREQCDLSLYF